MTAPTTSVLVVDDNPTNVKLLQLVLRSEGFRVAVAHNAAEALEALERELPEIVLMDLQLPGTDGLTLTRMLKANAATAALPVVAVTSYAMKGDEARARAAGCDGYITKPIDTRTLAEVIRGFLPPSASPPTGGG